MKSPSTPTIVFAIIQTFWVHVAVGTVANFSELLERLEGEIRSHPMNIFPFSGTDNVIGKLKNTSDEFKADCVDNYNRAPVWSMLSVSTAIHNRFEFYSENLEAGEKTILWTLIGPVDPIGFLVYLNEQNAYSSPDVTQQIREFFRGMPESSLRRMLETGSTSSGNADSERGSTSSGNAELERGSTSSGNAELETGSTSSGDTLECSICLKTLKPEDKWVAPRCVHAFHHECIQRWIDVCIEEATCPICRSPIRG